MSSHQTPSWNSRTSNHVERERFTDLLKWTQRRLSKPPLKNSKERNFLMTRFSSLTALFVTLLSLLVFFSPGIASAQTLQAKSHAITMHTAQVALHTAPSGVRRANYDPNDPSDSGCWN